MGAFTQVKAPMINPMSMERVGGDANGEKTQHPQPPQNARSFKKEVT